MASADQIKALLRSHADGDDERFFAVAMQVAAHEARVGHGKAAKELRAMIDAAKRRRKAPGSRNAVPITQPRGELSGLLTVSYPKARLADLIVDVPIQERLSRLIKEHRHVKKIRAHGLSPRRKLLLVGPPGTGKTLSASAIAGELNLALFVVRLDSLITKYMGETAAKLRLVFDSIAQMRGVYLFDEFDSIGAQRGITNEVGEIRRVLNSFLQFIEQDDSDSLVLAATNHPGILDSALYRRFDDVIEYKLPEREFTIKALQSKLASVTKLKLNWEELANLAAGMSYADIARACEEAIKGMIIEDRKKLTQQDLMDTLSQRQSIHHQ